MPRMLCLTIPGILACLWCVSALAENQETVSLRYQFRTGEVIRYSVHMDDRYSVQIGNSQFSPYSTQASTKSYKVVAVNDDGSAILQLTIEAVKIEVEQNGVKSTFDSDNPPKDIEPAFLPLAEMLGKPYLQLTVSPTGEVSNIKTLIEGGQKPEEISQAALDVLLRLPDEPVAVGGSWKEDYETNIQLENAQLKKIVKMQRRYFLRAMENGRATIEVKTKVISPVREPDEEIQLIRRTPVGTIVLDLEHGVLISRSLRQENTVVGFGGNPGSAMTFKQIHSEQLLPAQTAAGSAPSRK